MFDNAGSTIKKVGNLIFGISVIIAVLLFVLSTKTIGFIPALIIAAVCILTGFIQGLFLSAFGELVESNTQIKETNQEILKKLQEEDQES